MAKNPPRFPTAEFDDKENILDFLEAFFYRKNVCRVKMEEFAAAVWIRRQSLYHHFKNRETLLFALIERSFQKRLSALRRLSDSQDLKDFMEWLVFYPSAQKSAYSSAHAWNDYRGTVLEKRILEMQAQMRAEAMGYIENRFRIPQFQQFAILHVSRRIVEQLHFDEFAFEKEEVVKDLCEMALSKNR